MSKKALLLTGFLTENDVKNIQDNITGNDKDIQQLKDILNNKKANFVALDNINAGRPEIENIEKRYAQRLNEYIEKYNQKNLFSNTEWSFKSVEIGPLLCNAVFLDQDKIDNFSNIFKNSSYEDILKVCLDLLEVELKIKWDNNGLTLTTDNTNVLGFQIIQVNKNLQIMPQVNPSPVKIARVFDKYLLIDGYHRAVALKRAGHKKIPAVIFNNNAPLQPPRFRFLTSTLLKESPPVIEHYLNENYVSEVPLKRTINVFRILIDKSSIQI